MATPPVDLLAAHAAAHPDKPARWVLALSRELP
jgi:hypothetical protein